jgi:putative nucleotidyltransferase with HDIG domain
MRKNILFVDDEELVLKGMRRMLSSMRGAWGMDFVSSGKAALAALAEKQYHVIVADLLMPGMGGHELLKEVQRLYPAVKRIVLTGQPDRTYDKETVFPAHQYLMKPCDARTLIRVIQDILFVDDIIMDSKTKDLLSRLETLPAMPEIYLQITEELEREEPSLERVGELIGRDLGLVSKLITLFNSPYYGYHREILDVKYAVAYLGLDLIGALILTCQVFNLYDQRKIPGFSLQLLWEHSMRAACLSKRLAMSADGSAGEADHAFLAGMLHDIGKLILASNFPEEFNEILSIVRRENRAVHEVEREILGSSHAEAGAYLMGLWGVKPDIVKAIALHHSPASLNLSTTPLLEVYAGNIMDHMHTVINPNYSRREEYFGQLKDRELALKISEWEEDAVSYLKEQCL